MRLRVISAAAIVVLTGCRAGSGGDEELFVFAAASLTEAFEQLAEEFEGLRPGVDVRLNFAGSQSLRLQIENGARADVFASANAKHMDALTEVAETPAVFATNELVVVVPRDNPAGLRHFSDLPRAKRIVLAGAEVPAGAYSERVLEKATEIEGPVFGARVRANIVSRENDVRATLQKVVLGEADAAFVYATDAATVRDRVRSIQIPTALNIRAEYPIAALRGSSRLSQARSFVDFLATPVARARLSELGFGSASDGMSAQIEPPTSTGSRVR